MKKLKIFFFVSFFGGSLIVMNGCKKEKAFNNEQQFSMERSKSASDAVTILSAGNITVAGGGSFEELGATTTYNFNAVQHSNGVTNGHFLFHFRAAGGSMYVTIDCLRLFGDNKATMSGVITKLYGRPTGEFPAPPFIFIGGRVSFTVQDNGEGGSASPDLVSDIGELIPGVPASCADEWPVYLAGANVQISK
jgi:hypothetical protein